MKWTTNKLTDLASEIRVDLKNRKDEFTALLISDAHWDHPQHQAKRYKRVIDEAVELGAPIIYNGDTLCLMQSTRDRRATKGTTKAEHDEQDYFRAVAVDFVEEHRHAAANVALIGYGNHETAPLKHCNVDPVRMLADQFQRLTGNKPIVGGYRGWILFRVFRSGKGQGGGVRLYYFHGAGGGGPVTKGVIQTARRNAFIDGADIIWTGHVHERWLVDTPTIACSQNGVESVRTRWHLSTPGFKEEFAGAKKGWHVERGAPPKPIGAAWLKIFQDRDQIATEIRWTR